MTDVTLLFADLDPVAASLSPAHSQAERDAHDTLVRRLVEQHAGAILQTRDHAWRAVFPRAVNAINVAVALLRVEPHLRIALHTTPRAPHQAGFHPDYSHTAGLLAAGYGGCILLSRTTAARVEGWDALPGELRDLGLHDLKNLHSSERVYHLRAPGLPADLPPLRVLDLWPNNLPTQAHVLIGRDDEVQALCALLLQPDARLVTLTGPGGIGKTRLALQVAAELVDRFKHGVFFVAHDTDDPLLVPEAIAEALGVRETPHQALVPTLLAFLRERRVLLLLDTFEPVMDAAGFVADLLAAAPEVKVLVTSRAGLNLPGEREIVVPTLALPPDPRLPSLAELHDYPAIALFLQRAGDAKAGFTLTEDNAPTIVEICRRLDGLPLAIELAAARVKVLTPQAMLGRLENSLKLLTGGARDLPSRQQTMRGAITWSYDLLRSEERRVFHRLAVFLGGFTLDAAEQVGNAESDLEEPIQATVELLVDKSLLTAMPAGRRHDERRFSMLHTIREFGLERLEASGEAPAVRRRHALFFRALAEEAEAKLTSARQEEWLDRLDTEEANLRVALEWLIGAGAHAECYRLAGALGRFWSTRGRLTEGRRQLEAALAAERTPGPVEEWNILSLAGRLHLSARAKALHGAGTLCAIQGDYATARTYYHQCLALRRSLDDKRGIANILNNLGIIARQTGDYPTARTLYEESLELLHLMGDMSGVATTLNNLSLVLLYQGEGDRARRLLEESLTLLRTFGDQWGISVVLSTLGEVHLEQGDYPTAGRELREALVIFQRLGDRRLSAITLETLSAIAAVEGLPERALTLVGAAAALRRDIDAPLSPDEQTILDRRLAPAREALSMEDQEQAWQAGYGLSLEQAVTLIGGD